MRRRLTVTIADDVHFALHRKLGPGEISRFIEALVRPYAVPNVIGIDALEAEYRQATEVEDAELEALEWIEDHVDQVLGERGE